MINPPPDVRLVQNTFFPQYSVTMDWSLLPDGSLDDTQALATAVVVALGTFGLASPDDRLPDPDSSDRMGWWGDMDADIIRDSIQPFIDRKIASRYEVVSIRVDRQRIDCRVRLFRGPLAAVDLMYQMLWQGIE